MNYFKITWAFAFLFVLWSCDRTVYVAIRNYKEPCKIEVSYQRRGNTFIDSDTLFMKNINSTTFDSKVVRVNTVPNSYTVMVPRGKEIALKPTGLGLLIQQVNIFNSADSVWTINLTDLNERKKLSASGQIKTAPFSIIINNQ